MVQNKRKQVSKACTRCKQSHSCCGSERPCERCISLGLADTCEDSEQKKRGRKKKDPDEVETPKLQIDTTPISSETVWQQPFSVPDDFPIFNEIALNNLMTKTPEDTPTSFELELKLQGLKSIVEQQKKEIEELKRESLKLEEQQNQDKEKIITTFNANAFKCAFESSSFAMALMSATGDGKFLSWNNSFLKLLGYDKEFGARWLRDVVIVEDWKRAQETHVNCIKMGKNFYNLTLHFKKTTNQLINVISHFDILSDKDTKQLLFCLIIMTEKHE